MAPEDRKARVDRRIEHQRKQAANDRIQNDLDRGVKAMDVEVPSSFE